MQMGGCGIEEAQENNIVANAETGSTDSEEPEENEMAEKNTIITELSDVTQGNNLLENRKLLEDKIASLEKVPWTELTCYADEKTSLLNSNLLLNYGYLTCDEEGNIYFTDENIGGIFVSDSDGKNRRQLGGDVAMGLQLVGDWIYYQCTDRGGVRRLHRETCEVEVVREQPCGMYIVLNDKLYTNGPDGFCVADLDGTNKVILYNQSLSMANLQVSDGKLWLGTAINDTDAEFFMNGYLLGYDEAKDSRYYVGEAAGFHLLAGNWLSVWSTKAARRVVWDLEADTETDLGIWDQRSVSDGTYLYCSVKKYGVGNIFYRWNGVENEELFIVESDAAIDYKYLTPDKLYWLQHAGTMWELWYYDLETGEIGQIY